MKLKNKNKNNKLIEANKNKRSDLSDEINEQPDKLLEVVKEILDFNEEIQKQRGQGPRILTPNQMLSRLPTLLTQLKAENNSEKHKNKIRQLLYSLCRSKKLIKQLYKSLIDII